VQDKIIIALDGAANKLDKLHIKPQIIMGDFDSITHPYLNQHDAIILSVHDQDQTDLVKAIRYCDEQQAKSITIICALGGRLDHHEGNMRSLRAYYHPKRPILLHTEQQSVRYAKNETVIMKGEIGDPCGILAYPAGSFSSQGLLYDVENYPLEMGFSESICNVLREHKATITISGEALLIMPPQLFAQREFIKKSDTDRLAMQLRDAKAIFHPH
jgi:thiamine pyrophosphokinase